MDRRSDPAPAATASLETARAHVQSLSSSDREALLRALLEPTTEQIAELPEVSPKLDSEKTDDPTRLSVSTTASTESTGDASVVSSLSSSSSQGSPRPTSTPSTRAYWCLTCGKKSSSRTEWKQHDDEQHPEKPRRRRSSSAAAAATAAAAAATTKPTAAAVAGGHRRRAWGCGFCAAFLGSQDRFRDHAALHFESGKTLAHWHHGNVIYGLLHQPAVHEAWKALQAARYATVPRAQRPKMGWDAARTSGGGEGRLQSLLEHFDPGRHSAWDVARLADELAIRITVSVVDEADGDRHRSVPRISVSAPPGTAASAATGQQRLSKWASAAPAAASAPAPARAVSQPLPATERPLPQLALEDYYDPHPGTRVPIPDFLPAAAEHHRSLGPGAAQVFGDWDSLASTVVDEPRNFSLPCPRHWASSTQFRPSGAVA